MEQEKVSLSGDDSEEEIGNEKGMDLDIKRTNFAQDLKKEEEERRYINTKFKCDNDDDDDFKAKVDEMIEEINKLDVTNSCAVEEEGDVCSKCGEDILENALVVGEDNYHEECFTCDHCGSSLTGKFYQVGDQKYCEADQEVGLDRCSVCEDYLRSGSVMVGGASYHSHCFTCSACGVPIMDKFYTTDEGRWLCEEDYRLTKPKCYVCQLPVMERMLTAMDRQFHPSCFICSICQSILDGKPFMTEGDAVHCRDCYAKFKAAQCHRCNEAIVSSVGKRMTLITCEGKKYHYKCYSCQWCGDNLNGKQVFLAGEDVACGDCKIENSKQK